MEADVIKAVVKNAVREALAKNTDYGGEQGKAKIREMVKKNGKAATLEELKKNARSNKAARVLMGKEFNPDRSAEIWLEEALS